MLPLAQVWSLVRELRFRIHKGLLNRTQLYFVTEDVVCAIFEAEKEDGSVCTQEPYYTSRRGCWGDKTLGSQREVCSSRVDPWPHSDTRPTPAIAGLPRALDSLQACLLYGTISHNGFFPGISRALSEVCYSGLLSHIVVCYSGLNLSWLAWRCRAVPSVQAQLYFQPPTTWI